MGNKHNRDASRTFTLATSEARADCSGTGGRAMSSNSAPHPHGSLSSSSASFFSLARSTGYGTMTAGDAAAQPAAPHDSATASRRHSYDQPCVTPLAQPQAPRPRLSVSQRSLGTSASSGAAGAPQGGFTTISTRGPQRHHIAFGGDSPPPPPPQRHFFVPAEGNSAAATSSPAAFSRTDHHVQLSHPPKTLISALNAASPAVTSSAGDAPEVAAAAGAAIAPSHSATNGHSRARAALDKAYATEQQRLNHSSAVEHNSSGSIASYSGAVPQSITCAASSQTGTEPHHHHRHHLQRQHRSADINEALSEYGGTAVEVARPLSTPHKVPHETAHEATRCTSSSIATTSTAASPNRLPAHLSVDRLSRHAADAAVAEARRRVSVSASPFVPPSWRAGAQDRTSASESAKANTGALSTANAAAAEASHSPVKPMPARPSFTIPDNHVGTLKPSAWREGSQATSATVKSLHASVPAVRFIFTRSASTTTKPHSPERPRSLSVIALDNGATALVNGNTTHNALAPAESAASKPSRAATRAASEACGTLRGTAAPTSNNASCNGASESRRPSASVPFSRSSTYAHIRTRESSHAAAEDAAEARNRSRRESDSTAEAPTAAVGAATVAADNGRESRASMRSGTRPDATRDFDAAPQSYLQRWRQRQEEKQRKAEAAAADDLEKPTGTEGVVRTTAPDGQSLAVRAPEQRADEVKVKSQEHQPAEEEPLEVRVCHEESPPAVVDASSAAAPEQPAPATEGEEAASIQTKREAPADAAATTATAAAAAAVAEHSVSSLRDVVESGAVPETAAAALAAAVAMRSPDESASSILTLTQHPQPPQSASLTADVAATPASDTASHSRATPASRLAASTSFTSSYLTKDVARPEAADEDIPLDQVAPARAPPPSAVATQEPDSELASSPPPSLSETLKRTSPAVQHLSAASSARRSGGSSTTQLPQLQQQQQPSGTVADSDQPPALATRSPSTTITTSDEVRDLCRAVLERRDQRLQRQESLRTTGRFSPQPLQQQQQEKPSVPCDATSPADALADVVKASPTSPLQLDSQQNAGGAARPPTPTWKTVTTTHNSSVEEVALPMPSRSHRSSASASRAVTPATLGSVRRHSVVSPTSDDSRADGEAVRRSSAAVVGDSGTFIAEAHVEPVLLPSAYRIRARRRSPLVADAAATAGEPTSADARKSTSSDERDETGTAPEHVPGRPSLAYTALLKSIRQSRSRASSSTSGVPTPLPAAVDLEAGLAAVPTAAEIEENARQAKRTALLQRYRRSSAAASGNEDDEECSSDALPEESVKPDAASPALGNATSSAAPELSNSRARSGSSSARDVEASRRSSSRNSSVGDAFVSGADSEHHAAASGPPERAAVPPAAPSVPLTPIGQALTPVAEAQTPGSALAHIRVDDLDLLEQSVNALLKTYGGSTGTKRAGEEKAAGGPPKLTAAAALLRDMPPPAKTTTSAVASKQKATAAAAAKTQHVKSVKRDGLGRHSSTVDGHAHGPSRSAGLLSDDTEDEEDDRSSLWAASGLWCGDEAAYDAPPLPCCVPPLDLTTLLLPTGEPEDLKPYRIPLPSAVPAPDEAYSRLLRAIGAYPGVGQDAGGDPGEDGGSDVGMSQRIVNAHHEDAQSSSTSATGDDAASSSLPSSHASMHVTHEPAPRRLSKSSTSLTDVSHFVSERIQRMRAARQSAAAAAAAAAGTRRGTVALHRGRASVGAAAEVAGSGDVSRRDSNAFRAGAEGAAAGAKQSIADGGAAPAGRAIAPTPTTEDEAEDDISPSVGDATGGRRTAARRVLFTDDSDALDGGRGVDRDRHVGRQRNRVQRVLLECQEQRVRKDLLAQEANAMEVLSKHLYSRRR